MSAYLHSVPSSRMVELDLRSLIRFRDLALNSLRTRTTLPFLSDYSGSFIFTILLSLGFQVFTVLVVKNSSIFWDITTCSPW
jgi:hypothetical protein